MERLFQQILMLPQIVEIEKRIHVIEQINSLISKEAHLNVNYGDYRTHMIAVQSAGYELLSKLDQGKQNTNEFKKRMNDFLELLRTESRIPKFVEVAREV